MSTSRPHLCSLVLLLALAWAATADPHALAAPVRADTLQAPTPPQDTAPLPPAALEGATAMVSGAGHTFIVTAPEGWVLDSESGRSKGLRALFYPVGSSWPGASAFMYAVGVDTEHGRNETLDALVAGDVAAVHRSSPSLKLRTAEPLPTADGRHAAVRLLGAPGDEEAVALIREPRAIVVLTLTSHDPAAFARSRAAFDSLVASYRFLGDDALLER